MALPDLNASLIFDHDLLIGLSVIAQPQTEAELFCDSFPRKLMGEAGGGADMVVRDETLVLIVGGAERAWFAVPAHHCTRLNDILNVEGSCEGAQRSLCPDGVMTPGFKILLTEKESAETRREELEETRL